MKIDDNLFDEKIREQLKKENRYIPDKVDRVFDEAIESGRKRWDLKFRRVAGLCAAFIACIMILGMTVPTYASNVPIIGNLFEVFKLNIYENYDKYDSDLNISKENNGINFTINKVIYDGLDLEVFYTIESEVEMEYIPRFLDYQIKVNGNATSFSSGERGEFLDSNKIYIGNIRYSVNDLSVPKEIQEEENYGGYVEIPDEFLLSLEINEIGDIQETNIVKGSWNFDIPVSNEKLRGGIKEANINIDLGDIFEGAIVNKLVVTPINTLIQGEIKEKNASISGFMVFDDKGRYIQPKSGQGRGHEENGEYKYYFSHNFKEIYEGTKSLMFIPYDNDILIREWENSEKSKDSESGGMSYTNPELSELLNLQGETKLNSEDGKEYVTITKVEVVEGKTKLYFKSEYGLDARPREIVDNNTGEVISYIDEYKMNEGNKSKMYVYETGEFIMEYDGELTGNNYNVIYYDQSKSTRVYNDKAFTVNIPN